MKNKNSLGIFDPEVYGKEPILVIGVGGVGSVSAYYLAQMGCENITLVDYDEVELHNTASQFYKTSDIGKLKVEALKDNILDFTGVECTIINKKIETPDDIDRDSYKYVLVAVDNMDTRKFIIEQLDEQYVIETRMNGEELTIFCFRPLFEMDLWLGYWFPSEEALPELCTEKSVSYNTGMIGALVANKMKRLLKGEDNEFMTYFSFKEYKFLNQTI